MTTMTKIGFRLNTLEWQIEECESMMKEFKAKLTGLMEESPLDIANFAESYARHYKEAFEKKCMYEEEARILRMIAEEE